MFIGQGGAVGLCRAGHAGLSRSATAAPGAPGSGFLPRDRNRDQTSAWAWGRQKESKQRAAL